MKSFSVSFTKPGLNAWLPLFLLTLSIMATGCLHPKTEPSGFTVSWTNNLLTAVHPEMRGGPLQIWYLEAFCRSNAHLQSWDKTKIPHRTKLLRADPDGKFISFATRVEPLVEVRHDVQVRKDRIDFTFEFENQGDTFADIQWFQPACVRVGDFCRADQLTFITNCFVFTSEGRRSLDQMDRTVEALYRGGQVFLPESVPLKEANPRPVARKRITSGLMGCESDDRSQVLLLGSSTTHELFEGVYRCIHSDPHVGGLKPHERKRITAWLRLLPNDPASIKALAGKFPAKISSGD